MKLLRKYLYKNEPNSTKKKRVLESIEKNLNNYNENNISIRECLNKTGGLTADLIVYQNTDVYIPQSIYNSISQMSTNYYAMLYMADIHTSFYVMNKKIFYDQVVELMTEILEEETGGHFQNLTDDNNGSIYSANDFTRELVDAYYDKGYHGCLKYFASSVYKVLKTVNQNPTLKRARLKK